MTVARTEDSASGRHQRLRARRSAVWRTSAVAVVAAIGATLAACSAAITDTTTPEAPAGDSLVAIMGDGAWRATKSLKVSQPNGDLVIDGEDPSLRRLVITLFGFAGTLADGQTVTVPLDTEASGAVALAVLRSGNGASVWATSEAGSTGSITLTRDGRKASGAFSITLGPVQGTDATVFRSVFNGRFSITLP